MILRVVNNIMNSFIRVCVCGGGGGKGGGGVVGEGRGG